MARTISIRHGRAGEYLACYLLEAYAGLEASRIDGAFDLVVHAGDGRLVSVEVKSSSRRSRPGGGYKFRRPRMTVLADYYCFVALDIGLMRVFPGSIWRDRKDLSMPDKEFTQVAMINDLRWLKKELGGDITN
jgi:hypothetical protein